MARRRNPITGEIEEVGDGFISGAVQRQLDPNIRFGGADILPPPSPLEPRPEGNPLLGGPDVPVPFTPAGPTPEGTPDAPPNNFGPFSQQGLGGALSGAGAALLAAGKPTSDRNKISNAQAFGQGLQGFSTGLAAAREKEEAKALAQQQVDLATARFDQSRIAAEQAAGAKDKEIQIQLKGQYDKRSADYIKSKNSFGRVMSAFTTKAEDVQKFSEKLLSGEGAVNGNYRKTDIPLKSTTEALVKDLKEKTINFGDLALIYSFMRVLDPLSTVRESEFLVAARTGDVEDKVSNFINQILSGNRLTNEQRFGILVQSSSLMQEAEDTQRTFVQDQSTFAQGIGTADVFIPQSHRELLTDTTPVLEKSVRAIGGITADEIRANANIDGGPAKAVVTGPEFPQTNPQGQVTPPPSGSGLKTGAKPPQGAINTGRVARSKDGSKEGVVWQTTDGQFIVVPR